MSWLLVQFTKRQAGASSKIFSQLFITFSHTEYCTLSQALSPCQVPDAPCYLVHLLSSINPNESQGS